MKKKWQAVVVSLCLYSSTGCAHEGDNFFPGFKEDLVRVLNTADQQCDWMRALLDHKSVRLEDLSIDEVNKTIVDLESYIERLAMHKKHVGQLSNEESRCLTLTQELVRHLTNARASYKQKIETDESVKKIAISIGAGVAVFGGLMLLNALTPLDISVSAALLCGLVTGCVVGVVTHFDSLVNGVHSVSQIVHGSLPQGSSWHDGLKAVAAVGAVAIAAGVVYTKRGVVLQLFTGRKRGKKSLETMIQAAGLADLGPIV